MKEEKMKNKKKMEKKKKKTVYRKIMGSQNLRQRLR